MTRDVTRKEFERDLDAELDAEVKDGLLTPAQEANVRKQALDGIDSGAHTIEEGEEVLVERALQRILRD